jgi:hypothetical protein
MILIKPDTLAAGTDTPASSTAATKLPAASAATTTSAVAQASRQLHGAANTMLAEAKRNTRQSVSALTMSGMTVFSAMHSVEQAEDEAAGEALRDEKDPQAMVEAIVVTKELLKPSGGDAAVEGASAVAQMANNGKRSCRHQVRGVADSKVSHEALNDKNTKLGIQAMMKEQVAGRMPTAVSARRVSKARVMAEGHLQEAHENSAHDIQAPVTRRTTRGSILSAEAQAKQKEAEAAYGGRQGTKRGSTDLQNHDQGESSKRAKAESEGGVQKGVRGGKEAHAKGSVRVKAGVAGRQVTAEPTVRDVQSDTSGESASRRWTNAVSQDTESAAHNHVEMKYEPKQSVRASLRARKSEASDGEVCENCDCTQEGEASEKRGRPTLRKHSQAEDICGKQNDVSKSMEKYKIWTTYIEQSP